ncbi:hypothetical protein GF340_02380 [Candidatus Peregrinibacteria bacterium]|nr:hypothetical protein [Candidatus Peregrinibacteria bacterium]
MLDLILLIGSIVILLPLFYLISAVEFNLYLTIALILFLIPTIKALIRGAPFVPTPLSAVEKMIKEANLKDGFKVYDIGCGDGRIVHNASKQANIKAVGFELSPLVFLLAIIRKIFWKSNAKIKFSDFKWHNLSDADVVFCYLLPDTLARLAPKLEDELKKGSKIISYAFPIANWKETKKVPRNEKLKHGPIWIYEIRK